MKKGILLSLVVLVVVVAMSVQGTLPTIVVPQHPGQRISTTTIQHKAITVASVTIDATEPNYTEKTWTHAKALCVAIPVEWSNVALSFYGYGDGTEDGDPNDSPFSYDVYLVDLFSSLECVSSANTGTIGSMKLSHNPVTGVALTDPNSSYRWCDDLNEGTKKTTSTIAYSDYESTNGRAKTKFDRHTAYGIWVRLYDMTDEDVTSITCVMNGFNN